MQKKDIIKKRIKDVCTVAIAMVAGCLLGCVLHFSFGIYSARAKCASYEKVLLKKRASLDETEDQHWPRCASVTTSTKGDFLFFGTEVSGTRFDLLAEREQK